LGSSHPLAVLREQVAPGASDEELVFFAQVCERLDLSPFADQIVLIGRWDKRAGRTVHRHQLTVAGRRTLAVRTGRLAGIEGPVWCGPRNDAGELVWRDVWDDDAKPPYCARVLVHVHGWTVPANGTAKWSEFSQYDNQGKPLPLWRQMPAHMLGKCAESLALRRAFPDVIDPAVSDEFPFPVDGGGDDRAELAEATAYQDTKNRKPAFDSSTQSKVSGPELDSAGRVPGQWEPSHADQADAHRIVADLDADAFDRFLADWRIDDFGAAWPPDAVADALSRRPSS
jgi:hypothetical protein